MLVFVYSKQVNAFIPDNRINNGASVEFLFFSNRFYVVFHRDLNLSNESLLTISYGLVHVNLEIILDIIHHPCAVCVYLCVVVELLIYCNQNVSWSDIFKVCYSSFFFGVKNMFFNSTNYTTKTEPAHECWCFFPLIFANVMIFACSMNSAT